MAGRLNPPTVLRVEREILDGKHLTEQLHKLELKRGSCSKSKTTAQILKKKKESQKSVCNGCEKIFFAERTFSTLKK